MPPCVDTHVHVFEPQRFAYPDGPGYRPLPHESGTASDLARVLAQHGVSHAVIVQPSGYGTDNRALLDAVAGSAGRYRGIVAVDGDVSDDALDRLAEGGAVGVRVDLPALLPDGAPSAQVRDFFARLRSRGWLLQVQCPPAALAPCLPALQRSGLTVIVDHIGCIDAGRDLDQPGVADLLDFGRSGQAVIKLSGAFRYSHAGYPHDDAGMVVAALLDAFTPRNAVWASDWPFIKLAERPDYADVLALVERWLPGAADRRTVLWETPARLYGFAAAAAERK